MACSDGKCGTGPVKGGVGRSDRWKDDDLLERIDRAIEEDGIGLVAKKVLLGTSAVVARGYVEERLAERQGGASCEAGEDCVGCGSPC